MILALSLALHCSVLLGLPVAMFFAAWIRDPCPLLWPLFWLLSASACLCARFVRAFLWTFLVNMSDYYHAGWLHGRILEQGFQQPHHRSRLWTVFFGLGITHAFMPTENSFSGFKPACHNDNNNNTKAYIALDYLVSISALHNSKKCSLKFRKTYDL